MSESEHGSESEPSADSYESYFARYCENCGQVHDGTDMLTNVLSEPIHRVDILEALGGVEDEQVHETTAMEDGTCECSGQIVKRYYAVGEVPEPEYEPDDDQIRGRDPDDDSLVNFGGGWKESREVPWLEDGGSA